MGIRKFRSVEEMPGPRPRPPLDPDNLRIAFELSALACGLSPRRYEPGIRRFRSWNDALEARARQDRAGRRRLPKPAP